MLISSHLLSEMSLTADHLVVIGRGRLVASQSTYDFVKAEVPIWKEQRHADGFSNWVGLE